jgi:hypothetical protein
MTLIENWRSAWRMLSVQAMTIAGALQGAWLYLPDDMRSSVDPKLMHGTTIALLVLGVVGRMVKQDKVSGQ